jgi:hypothetical protein
MTRPANTVMLKIVEKNKRLDIRVSPSELAIIQERADGACRSVSEFVRAAALDKPLTVRSYKQLDPGHLAQFKRVGNPLNQIAATLHAKGMDGGTALLLHAALDELRQLIRRELGVDTGQRS